MVEAIFCEVFMFFQSVCFNLYTIVLYISIAWLRETTRTGWRHAGQLLLRLSHSQKHAPQKQCMHGCNATGLRAVDGGAGSRGAGGGCGDGTWSGGGGSGGGGGGCGRGRGRSARRRQHRKDEEA